MSAHDDVARFWAYCADVGVVSKRLVLRHARDGSSSSAVTAAPPLVLVADEALAHGSLVASVPYTAVLNAQTLRGGMLPRCTPPFATAARFLTRRGRMSMLTASALWLVAFVACQRRQVRAAQQQQQQIASRGSGRSRGGSGSSARGQRRHVQPCAFADSVAPLLSPTLLPVTTATTTTTTTTTSDALQRQALLLLHALLAFYARRTCVPRALLPTLPELQATYATVRQRALPLPLHCTPSAPEELAELLATSPQLPQLASLVPVIDLLRPVRVGDDDEGDSDRRADNDEQAATAVAAAKWTQRANCTIYTCVEQSQHVAAMPPARRHVLVAAAPLSARRVVACTTSAVRAGDELCVALD